MAALLVVAGALAGCGGRGSATADRKDLDAVLLGSETVKVLTHSKIPVLVVR